jgi:hypothetical protein
MENKGEQPRTEAANTGEQARTATNTPEQPRTDANVPPPEDRYVARLENENDFLRTQIAVKDEQIKDLTERSRETNFLIQGLQKMLTPLLLKPNSHRDGRDASPADESAF